MTRTRDHKQPHWPEGRARTGLYRVFLCAASCLVLAGMPSALAQDEDPKDPLVNLELDGRASAVVGSTGDGDVRGDVNIELGLTASRVFNNGLELGATLEGRYDEDQPKSLFSGGRRSSLLTGGPRGVGPFGGDAYLQSAFGYARGPFGKIVVGRDSGVAQQLAVTAPTIFQAVNVNDWRTDVSNLNDIHTVNDFSGYATKVSYLPPANFLGGIVGGLQLGVSYAPSLAPCDNETFCAPQDESLFATSDRLLNEGARYDNVVEGAVFYQKGLDFGADGEKDVFLGLGASVVTANEDTDSVLNIFEDYRAYSLGINLAFRGLTVGGSVKTTNTGIRLPGSDNDDYFAFDAGVTYNTGDWGFMLGYGQSEANIVAPAAPDSLIFRDTQSAQAGVTYFLGRGITIGAAAQFIDSKKPATIGGQEDAVTAVIETGIRF